MVESTRASSLLSTIGCVSVEPVRVALTMSNRLTPSHEPAHSGPALALSSYMSAWNCGRLAGKESEVRPREVSR